MEPGDEHQFSVHVQSGEVAPGGGAVTRVVVRGEVDTATAGLVEAAWPEALEPGTPVEVDLSGVSFIDSSGLRSLVVGHKAAVAAGVGLTIVEPTTVVRRLLDITGLTETLLG